MSLHRRSIRVLAVDLASSLCAIALDVEYAIRRQITHRRQVEADKNRHPAGGRETPIVDDQIDPRDLDVDLEIDDDLTPAEQAEWEGLILWARELFGIHPISVTAEVTALEHDFGAHPLWDEILRDHEEDAR